MGKPAAAAAGGPAKAARPDLNPLVYMDLVNKELLRARQFGATWGALSAAPVAKTLDEAVELKDAEVKALRTAAGPAATAAANFSTTQRASFPHRADLGGLEAGLGKAYKVLRAGI